MSTDSQARTNLPSISYSISKYRFDPKDTQALRLWDVIENEKIFGKILFGMTLFMMITGVLTLIVGGVGVANIMYIAVRQPPSAFSPVTSRRARHPVSTRSNP